VAAPSAPPPERIGRGRTVGADEALADLFERVAELERHRDRRGGLTFVLDLAMETIGCDAGSVFTAQLAGRYLDFAVARGPRADQIARLGVKVPVGSGIVGFCAQENVCLAVCDAQRDPRFHRAISQAIGYDTRSILCAPMAREGRLLGALELLNKTGGLPFDEADVAVLSYLAHRGAEFLVRLEA
jgi:signal transduction protein with GAF and PtsI domain